MNRWIVFSCGSVALAVCGSAVLACNGLLGIGPASVASDDAGDSPSTSCQDYCNTIMQNCQGPNAEYLTSDVCAKMCPAFESNGTVQDSKDDTLDCRLFNAQKAASDPGHYCRFAGPLGGGHCGDSCEAFCTLDTGYCNRAPVSTTIYPTAVACEGACKGFPYLLDAGDTQLESTDTLNCRLWHLETAFKSTQNGQFHCPHTAVSSATCFNIDLDAGAGD